MWDMCKSVVLAAEDELPNLPNLTPVINPLLARTSLNLAICTHFPKN